MLFLLPGGGSRLFMSAHCSNNVSLGGKACAKMLLTSYARRLSHGWRVTYFEL